MGARKVFFKSGLHGLESSECSAPLVETQWLGKHLGDAKLRIFDTTAFLVPQSGGTYLVESGLEEFQKQHIPNAGFLDLTRELSDPSNPLPFMMPGERQFSEVVAAKGVSNDSFVVLYSAGSMMWSTRVWWMFRAFGFDRVAVLDGGWNKWQREGRPVSSAETNPESGVFTAQVRAELIAGKSEIRQAISDDRVCTIYALSPEVYRGEGNRHSGRPGHIPGSRNVYHQDLVDPDSGTFLDLGRLKEQFAAVGAFEKERIILYCGGGIASTLGAMALFLAGHERIAVYDGSMREWSADRALTVTTGEDP